MLDEECLVVRLKWRDPKQRTASTNEHEPNELINQSELNSDTINLKFEISNHIQMLSSYDKLLKHQQMSNP